MKSCSPRSCCIARVEDIRGQRAVGAGLSRLAAPDLWPWPGPWPSWLSRAAVEGARNDVIWKARLADKTARVPELITAIAALRAGCRSARQGGNLRWLPGIWCDRSYCRSASWHARRRSRPHGRLWWQRPSSVGRHASTIAARPPHHSREPSASAAAGAASHAAIDHIRGPPPLASAASSRVATGFMSSSLRGPAGGGLRRIPPFLQRTPRISLRWVQRRSTDSGGTEGSGGLSATADDRLATLPASPFKSHAAARRPDPIKIYGNASAHLSETDHGDIAPTAARIATISHADTSSRHLGGPAKTKVLARRSPSPGQRT